MNRPNDITLETIRAAAERLGNAAVESEAVASMLRNKLSAAVAPIYAQFRPALDATAEFQAEAQRELMALLEAAPQLFGKGKRSLIANGVRAGYRKGDDTLAWDSDDIVIKRIKALLPPETADLCIRTTEGLVYEALAQLPQADLARLGVSRIPGVDNPFITVGAGDVDTLIKAILAAAQQRQGEEDKPKAKKGKVKAKEGA